LQHSFSQYEYNIRDLFTEIAIATAQ
jgi:hypothetical protein